MESNKFNSLKEQLIHNNIISDGNEKNIFNNYDITPDEDMSHSPFVNQPIKEEENIIEKNQKRLNEYDLNLIKRKDIDKTKYTFATIKRFLNFKESKLNSKSNFLSLEKIFFLFFPKLYKAKIAKDALKKLTELDIDTKLLHDKTIPYGEAEMRYDNLIKYLNYANEIQNKVKKKCN